MMVEGSGFSDEQAEVVVRAILAGADAGWISEERIVQIADMLWEDYVAGQLVEMVLAGELKVSLLEGELVFQSMKGGEQ